MRTSVRDDAPIVRAVVLGRCDRLGSGHVGPDLNAGLAGSSAQRACGGRAAVHDVASYGQQKNEKNFRKRKTFHGASMVGPMGRVALAR